MEDKTIVINIHKVAEDQGRAAYICQNGTPPPSLIIVDKMSAKVSALITGDQATAAGSIAKIRRKIANGDYPDRLTVQTG